MAEEIGIKETNEAVDAFTGLLNPFLDGFQMSDPLALIPVFGKLGAAIEGFDQIPKEAANFTGEESDQLAATAINNLTNVKEEIVQEIIPDIIRTATAMSALVLKLKNNLK